MLENLLNLKSGKETEGKTSAESVDKPSTKVESDPQTEQTAQTVQTEQIVQTEQSKSIQQHDENKAAKTGKSRKRRGLEEEEEVDRTTTEAIDLLLQQNNDEAIKIIKQKPEMLSTTFTHRGQSMSSAVAISGHAYKPLLTAMIDRNLFILGNALLIEDSNDGSLYISSPVMATVAADNIELMEFLAADNSRMAKKLPRLTGRIFSI